MESIHRRIKRLREAKGLSQEGLAKLVGVNGVKYQSVQEWEREGGTAPSRKHQTSVSQALGVSVAELMHGSAGTQTEQPLAAYSVPTEALEIARAWAELTPVCQDHVRRQIALLRGAEANNSGRRRRAAQQDVEIKGGALKSSARQKARKGVR